jgi:tetratricopeptide (TPR) repeat protein
MADQEAEQVIRRAMEADDLLPVCWAHNARGIIALYQNRNADGEKHLSEAIRHFRALGDRPGEASALCNLSRIHLATGRTQSAVDLARQGIDIYDAMGNSMRGANARYALGMALTQSGGLASAADRLAEALAVFRDSRQRLWEGMTLFRMAEVDMAALRPAQAAANAELALTVLRGIGGEWRRGNVLTVLGHALTGIGQTDRARVCWLDALRIYEGLGASEAAVVSELLRTTQTV